MKFIQGTFSCFIAVVFLLVITPSLAAVNLTGAGGTFPAPMYAKWADAYFKNTGNRVNYQGIGSSGGIRQVIAKTIDFGGTDIPMSEEDLNRNDLFQFPTLTGGIVVVVNIPGIASGQLILDGETLGDIYLGKIKRWNDPAIVRLNPGLNLPGINIAVVRRSDGAGSTYVFTRYLEKVNSRWKANVGSGATVRWPTGLGGKGNDGVAAFVQRLRGSIGYVEYTYAKPGNMAYTRLVNAEGKAISPNEASFRAAGDGADWSQSFSQDLTNQKGDNAWPVTSATFILIPKKQRNIAKGKEILRFFDWAFKNGDNLATELDFAALPDPLVEKIRTAWQTNIKDSSGIHPLYP
ncbi:phosphate ABC transporter substrate-binding protein PstS [Rahnella victoriana]|uniref:phosphate ABC transporter substrate-binding protein PstS n=1 Tax=Rahnella victoriana TaxID=1510570 RepID=UPI0010F127EE|nr:phosphate ABC transporter substrate-binding protein PstS [Rahnella victoriana]UHM93189.1 phosphate ABC transporter substrate-binding protein PstS [Rahnella victoriana]VTQ52093.1 phosphate ABC transporter, phosphate-binding protein PstS [Campylobacter jejuni]